MQLQHIYQNDVLNIWTNLHDINKTILTKDNKGVFDRFANKKATISCHDNLWLEGFTTITRNRYPYVDKTVHICHLCDVDNFSSFSP